MEGSHVAIQANIQGNYSDDRNYSTAVVNITNHCNLNCRHCFVFREGNPNDATDGKDWHGSGTILIVDDEETVCTVGKQMLERLGFSVLTAPDGRRAVEVYREHAADIVCVLLDLTMPHMDGEEAFREIRRIQPDARVVLCSGYNMQDATQRFAGKGLASFLQKPYNMTALKEILMPILGDESSATQDDVEPRS